MKILVVCQYYYPEPFRITDICQEWVRRGHDVTVLTGLPNYPMGEIYDGYKTKDKRYEVIEGVKVHRCYEIPRRKGPLFRMLNYYSFDWSARRYIKRLKEDFDVVFINQLSPVMMARAGIKYAKAHKVKSVMYCLDLWPESLVAGGIKRGSLLYNHYHKVSKQIYKNVDKILVTSRAFEGYLKKEFGIADGVIDYLPQYAEDLFDANSCKKTPDGYIDLLFAGNVGTAQSLQTVIMAAKKTMDIKNLRWHIVGDGSDLERIKGIAKRDGVDNVTFYGRRPLEEMPDFYKKADAMLVTLMDDDFLSMTLPGKVQTYMATGKPIIVSANGEVATVVESAECGYVGPAEDVDGLVENVRKFCQIHDTDEIVRLGDNAKVYSDEHFKREKFFECLENMTD